MANKDESPDLVEAEELIALIKAIKFAYADYGAKRVHDEIKSHGGKYARVPLKRVKKYMQKLGLMQSDQDPPPPPPPTGRGGANAGHQDARGATGPIQLMTIGGNSKSTRPTTQGSTGGDQDPDEHKSEAEAPATWLPVKLDEPATKMSAFPYQAVIRMTTTDDGAASGRLGEIYKIQVAMGERGGLSDSAPMLLYNKARDRKTFVHPDAPAYAPVLAMIRTHGAHGAVGGVKAYLWGRYRAADDLLYLNTTALAPAQKW